MTVFEVKWHSSRTPLASPVALHIAIPHLPNTPIVSYDASTGVFGPPGLGINGILNIARSNSYRFALWSNTISTTIHGRSLNELAGDGRTFEELFVGCNIVSSHSVGTMDRDQYQPVLSSPETPSQVDPDPQDLAPPDFTEATRVYDETLDQRSQGADEKIKHPLGVSDSSGITWWLDVLDPTEEEMKALSKVFSIHPLTAEDILTEETREKVELFRNYYFVCFRSFDQDQNSPTYLEPLNMYIIVFKEGVLSFHFMPTPHPQNVRKRIKQLKDYINVTPDWISYAIIDDITVAFGPLIQGIEYEVDSIDELAMIMRDKEQSDMLRRIGTCRKKVLDLLRLMANKADVVRGLAKRCNEDSRAASPTLDIGLYLTDIRDHLVTMTQNLNHYEMILSRSHSNYLAQLSINMTNANNQINNLLSKLTALGTVLIPMNIVTGLWGMNVHVPGQFIPGFAWFLSIIGCLVTWAVVATYAAFKFMVPKQKEL